MENTRPGWEATLRQPEARQLRNRAALCVPNSLRLLSTHAHGRWIALFPPWCPDIRRGLPSWTGRTDVRRST
jgi:hypothetical protein